jgi:hypothetical protein
MCREITRITIKKAIFAVTFEIRQGIIPTAIGIRIISNKYE